MATPPKIRNVDEIKSVLLQPALTSHYECYFQIPSLREFSSLSQGTVKEFMEQPGSNVSVNSETITKLILSCSEATLPGSNLATHELNNDFTGVTQRHAYRRLYDDRADFTFYVNNDYLQIRLFERWMQFIVGEQQSTAPNPNNFYRVVYPKSYKTTIYITKFERTVRPKIGKDRENSFNEPNYYGKRLCYSFYNAFPISIASMPVSYESSQLLKCTVSFTYDRYLASPNGPVSGGQGDPGVPSTANGVPNPFEITPEFQANLNAVYTQNLNIGNYSSGTFTNTNFDNIFDTSDPTRIFQQNDINQIDNRAFSSNFNFL